MLHFSAGTAVSQGTDQVVITKVTLNPIRKFRLRYWLFIIGLCNNYGSIYVVENLLTVISVSYV